ncbi:response regulator transcription factor [Anaerosporobacter faecicola]|uniref:response regulator transcription factor n=1 Tax=Anaerosporobacter faecicola TaxID=2718714 RepID=UPI001439A88F|nr:response regulator transcription factor [Anaerosporobacter faecicola]
MAKIIFLEDEPTIQEVTTEYFKMAGHEVTVVRDGKEAIDAIDKATFEVAVLDIMVPKISGMEVLSYIRKNKPDMAVIMLSALDDEQTQVHAFNLFADDYIIKPFSPILLLKRIETILHRRVGKTQEKKETEELLIDEEAYQAFYKKQSLYLTVSEFLLLKTLASEPNRVFQREQLIQKIFQEDICVNDRIIDAHVKNLRKKLPRNYIKTVIGVGYQFDREAKE